MAGTVVNFYGYEPFGKILAEQETVAQPFKYVGKYGVMAEPSGLYYMRARYHRLLSAGSTSYAYDNEGQLSTAGSTANTFDYDHRLAGIGSDAQFRYDGGGNRLSATRAGLTTRYIYDPWGNLLAEADAFNQITRKCIYGKGLIALATPTDRYCYHFDATGHKP